MDFSISKFALDGNLVPVKDRFHYLSDCINYIDMLAERHIHNVYIGLLNGRIVYHRFPNYLNWTITARDYVKYPYDDILNVKQQFNLDWNKSSLFQKMEVFKPFSVQLYIDIVTSTKLFCLLSDNY